MPRLPAIKRFLSSTGVRIYRIPCEVLPDLCARVYLLLGAGPPTLIDSGSGQGESTAQILAGLETVRTQFGEPVRPADVRRILVTHAHFDHIGGLADLVRHTGAEVAVHPLDRRVVAAWDERATLFTRAFVRFLDQAGVEPADREQLIARFGFTPGRVPSVPVSRSLEEGEPLDGLRVVHTPGHSPGHVCLAAGNVLVCGDHLLPRTIPQQWPESLAPGTGLGHYLESLRKVGRLEGIELALGGHEPPIEHVGRRIEEIRASHFRRLDRLLDLLAKARAPLSIAELTRRMYSNPQGFRAVLALFDVGSRVEHLDQHGRLEIANLDEIERQPEAAYRYRPA